MWQHRARWQSLTASMHRYRADVEYAKALLYALRARMAHSKARTFPRAALAATIVALVAVTVDHVPFPTSRGATLATAAELPEAQVPPAIGATADIHDATNRLFATAEFREGRGEVLISITLPPQPVLTGAHAIHIDEIGRCDPPDFSTSGSIFNPFSKNHGRRNPQGAEVGDLPNLNLSSAVTSYNTSAVGATLAGGAGSLLSPSRSILIYSGEDDQQTDPDGNSGSPIACGVITASAPASSTASATAVPAPVMASATLPASPAAITQRTGQPTVVGAQPQPAASQAVLVRTAASPSPISVAPVTAPTPILVLPTNVPIAATAQRAPQTSTGTAPVNSLVIAVLGICLISSGYMLRRKSAS